MLFLIILIKNNNDSDISEDSNCDLELKPLTPIIEKLSLPQKMTSYETWHQMTSLLENPMVRFLRWKPVGIQYTNNLLLCHNASNWVQTIWSDSPRVRSEFEAGILKLTVHCFKINQFLAAIRQVLLSELVMEVASCKSRQNTTKNAKI